MVLRLRLSHEVSTHPFTGRTGRNRGGMVAAVVKGRTPSIRLASVMCNAFSVHYFHGVFFQSRNIGACLVATD